MVWAKDGVSNRGGCCWGLLVAESGKDGADGTRAAVKVSLVLSLLIIVNARLGLRHLEGRGLTCSPGAPHRSPSNSEAVRQPRFGSRRSGRHYTGTCRLQDLSQVHYTTQ